jgi:hypothetical protein
MTSGYLKQGELSAMICLMRWHCSGVFGSFPSPFESIL